MFSIIISEKGGGERREVFDQTEVTVGRVQGNDLMLPKGNVSKRHCRLELSEGRFVVTDQNSTNGTYINRRRITQSTVVRQGDRIYVGDFVLRIELDSPSEDNQSKSEVDLESPARAPMSTTADIDSGAISPSSLPSRRQKITGDVISDRGTAGQDVVSGTDITELIDAIGKVIDRVSSKLDPRALDRDIDAALERRVARALEEAVAELKSEALIVPEFPEEPLTNAARAELLGLGPLDALLVEPSVLEIAISGPGHIAVYRGTNRSEGGLPFCHAASIPRALARLCREHGVNLTGSESVLYAALPALDFELKALRGPDTALGTALRLVRRARHPQTMEDLVRLGVVSRTMATFLRHCVGAGVNIVVVGPERSGATEVLSALCSAADGDRVLAFLDDRTLVTTADNVTPIAASAEQLTAVLKTAAGFGGHRLLIDGLSGERAWAALQAISEGGEGALARVRARGIERGLNRLCADVSLRHPGVSPAAVAESLIATFDVAMEVARLPDGRSRVVRISELAHGEGSLIRGADIFDFIIERTATGGSIEGTFRATGHSPHVATELKSRGTRIDTALFSRPPNSEERDQRA